ncbi:TatD family hydrolase, partial [bacterium]|nr:TatD family hydrolase [bacterium]
LALQYNLPLVIHTRDAADDTLICMEEFKNESNLQGVFHCFSQDQTFADYAVDELSFLLGIGGPITYPNNNSLRTIVKKHGLANIILETDAPYLPPQIIRGKKNHPKYIREIALYIAKLLQKNFETVAQQTTENAFKLFTI